MIEMPKSEMQPASDSGLSGFQRECINLFVHGAQILSIPRSIGEIYGLLYATAEPLPMEAIMERLGISKGSVSQGLRWLREVGAVRATYVTGDRRDHYEAETELRKLAGGFLREQIEPHLGNGGDYLARLALEAGRVHPAESRFVEERITKLKRWYRLTERALPLFLRIVGRI